MNNNNNNNKNGGKVLASGGFGCVFTPALKCINNDKRDKNKISKLMTNKNAIEEFDELVYLNNKLNSIKNYENYFLIDGFRLCRPEKLTKNDLKNYNTCNALKKDNITPKNINDSLDKLLAINMPYGGNTIEYFMINNKDYKYLIEMNNRLIDLLKNGILKMNKKNIYHSDIKASNILIKINDNHNDIKVRLIDWSLTVEYIPFKDDPFPNNWRNRPLQFNVPFSVILFTDLFYENYSKFLENNENKTLLLSKSNSKNIYILKHKKLDVFIRNYLKIWIEHRGSGHYNYINKIMYMLFKHDVIKKETNKNNDKDLKIFIEKHYTIPYIVNYLVEILIHFTKFKNDGSLNIRNYLDNIFIHLIDIWGFVISYIPLYELLFENYKYLTKTQMEIFMNLKIIFLKFMYQPQIDLINIKDLENHLKKINILLENQI
jgi:serine/threonine protein kinase